MQVIANYENVSNDNVHMNLNMNYSKADISVYQQNENYFNTKLRSNQQDFANFW